MTLDASKWGDMENLAWKEHMHFYMWTFGSMIKQQSRHIICQFNVHDRIKQSHWNVVIFTFLLHSHRYTILAISFFLILMTFYIVPTRDSAEAFSTCWSSLTLICLCVGGTMVMRKFHNSFSTGLFLGGVVGAAQYFFLSAGLYYQYQIQIGTGQLIVIP